MLQALCAVAKKPVRCLRGHGDPVRIKRLANRPIKVLSATLLDKRGYGNLSGSIGVCHPERSDSSGCHPERAKRVEGSRAAAGARCASESMAASDVAFLAPELVSEAEGPVPVPAPAEGRLGYRFVKRVFDIAFSRPGVPRIPHLPPKARRVSRKAATHLQAAYHGGRLRRC